MTQRSPTADPHRFPKGLLLDLETSPDGRRILKIGAVLGSSTLLRAGHFDPRAALAELDRFAAEAECVIGHNLLEHDLAVLAECDPHLALLKLPVVDTLYLSPICFPENPYHRLDKDYKLVSESLNDPVADARLAADVRDPEFAKHLRTDHWDIPSVELVLRAKMTRTLT